MLDYLMEIRKSLGQKEGRRRLVKEFDKRYAVGGARVLNRKFELMDAVNNAIKHMVLERDRYKEVHDEYGSIGFRCLREDGGLVLFEVGSYRFDFGRVVLRPVLNVVVPYSFDGVADVADFSTGELSDVPLSGGCDDPDDPIDRMSNYCNAACLDCGEGEDGCRCSEFIYAGEQAEFQPDRGKGFDFDAVMSEISGAYRRS